MSRLPTIYCSPPQPLFPIIPTPISSSHPFYSSTCHICIVFVFHDSTCLSLSTSPGVVAFVCRLRLRHALFGSSRCCPPTTIVLVFPPIIPLFVGIVASFLSIGVIRFNSLTWHTFGVVMFNRGICRSLRQISRTPPPPPRYSIPECLSTRDVHFIDCV